MNWGRFQGWLFDLDGVITPTAEAHMRAWRETFAPFLASIPGQRLYGTGDYFAHLDGKLRLNAVRDLLASRGIFLPEGEPDDDPSADTINGLGNRKNQLFGAIVRGGGVRAYPGSEVLVRQLADGGRLLAAVSSSRNAESVIRSTGLRDFFNVVVDGQMVAERHLAGKPAPDMFFQAAELLGVPAQQCVVFEDAVVGVEAGAAGGFGLVVGIDRGIGAGRLRRAGADLVLRDLAEVSLS
ncbi:haloacid dehalogenase superfamily, subfamily IA, variant 3 with third motif having DD or ED/beta-phosphoglucomutase family hydrolase [Tessaracoccus bendigoensis DSM 12906]|uniref:Beta-phosphoglucomutase n=1 Tax=Tessaracoccus bendigoensis DSM 12906 TaxID=1123357 RepID=A0A1M6C2A2_9ACTN|nr:beta-phosphoglucomutase family hydrolase [Tessaracoccus bendigoensis]SHI55072.1 haloacid dehalogenase superfamily, subfamily IA, variant 3 with third motif having DD or ED/beta-phosphoglucomutase family hydrolase [Tessaracoccus bendigoensis DSM 12906]